MLIASIFKKIFKTSSVYINNHLYFLNDKIFFKDILIHPVLKFPIDYGILVDIYKKNNREYVLLYLADAYHYSNNDFCSSYLKEFELSLLSKNIKCFN